jgi:hypothetical protein
MAHYHNKWSIFEANFDTPDLVQKSESLFLLLLSYEEDIQDMSALILSQRPGDVYQRLGVVMARAVRIGSESGIDLRGLEDGSISHHDYTPPHRSYKPLGSLKFLSRDQLDEMARQTVTII